MKTVRLPIYEDGFDTGEYLEIDTRHFLGAANSELSHNYIKVVQAPSVEEEMEVVDRIIHGLAPRPQQKPLITKKVKSIPGFSKYKMDSLGRIYDEHDRTVSITKGMRFDNAFLENDAGDKKRMSVDYLFEKTFPEYK